MLKTLPWMKLSHDEDLFLRHWMYEELHFRDGPGPAKRLQVEHRASPADLASIIAAAIPNPTEQEAAGMGPPPSESPRWPWSDDGLSLRLAEARALLETSPNRAPRELSPRADGNLSSAGS
jgi:hypothetical protein